MGKRMRVGAALLGVCSLALGASVPVLAQDVFAYPTRGQTPEQQQQDMAACHAWAVQQTGYDPSRPPAQAAPPPAYAAEAPRGGVFRGAARGALVGTVGGAITGHAGRGAEIGAATGGLMGGMRRNDQRRQQAYAAQAYQQQQGAAQAAQSQQRGTYDRALGACLGGRGYSIS